MNGPINIPIHQVAVSAPANVSAGDVLTTQGFAGVAAGNAASGDMVSVYIDGVFQLPADDSTAFNTGDQLQWDGTKLIKQAEDGSASSAYYTIGACVANKLSSGTTALVQLNKSFALPKGIRSLADGASAATVTVPSGLAGRPVLVSVASAAGAAWTASTAVAPAFKAAISSTTLTITMVDPVTGSAKAAGTGATIKLAYAVL